MIIFVYLPDFIHSVLNAQTFDSILCKYCTFTEEGLGSLGLGAGSLVLQYTQVRTAQ